MARCLDTFAYSDQRCLTGIFQLLSLEIPSLARGSEFVWILLENSSLLFFVSLLQKHNPHQFRTCLKRFSTIMAFHFNTPSQTPLRKPFSSGAQIFCNVEIFPWGTLFRTLKNIDFPVLSVRIGLLRKNPNHLPKPL